MTSILSYDYFLSDLSLVHSSERLINLNVTHLTDDQSYLVICKKRNNKNGRSYITGEDWDITKKTVVMAASPHFLRYIVI